LEDESPWPNHILSKIQESLLISKSFGQAHSGVLESMSQWQANAIVSPAAQRKLSMAWRRNLLHGKSLQPFGSHVKEIDFRTFDLFHMISRTEFAELWLQALFFGDPFPELRHVLLASIPMEAIFWSSQWGTIQLPTPGQG